MQLLYCSVVRRTSPSLVDVLDLDSLGDDRFRGAQREGHGQRVFGGHVVAQALVAATRTSPATMTAHSLHAYFLRMGDPTVEIEYGVDRLRDGRSFATRRVQALQHGKPIFEMMASFHVAEPGFDHHDPMPMAPLPDDLREHAGDPGAWWRPIDMRHAGDTRRGDVLGDNLGVAEARSWIRYDAPLPDDPRIHQAVLAYMSDLTLFGTAALPHGEPGFDDFSQMASLDHSIWFHRPTDVGRWLLFAHRSPSAQAARGLVYASFFTECGVLVASVAQEGLMRPASTPGEHRVPNN